MKYAIKHWLWYNIWRPFKLWFLLGGIPILQYKYILEMEEGIGRELDKMRVVLDLINYPERKSPSFLAHPKLSNSPAGDAPSTGA